jgi:glycosyltransferase involved in cell wall biosynthesis
MEEKDDESLIKMKNVLSYKVKILSDKKVKAKFKKVTPDFKNLLGPTIFCFLFVLVIIVLILHFKKAKNKVEMKNAKLNTKLNTTKEELVFNNITFNNITISYQKAQDFLNKAISGTLLNKTNYVESDAPKVSAIIPVYNSKGIILRSIRSIQNQNMKNIEIILVNDFSTDDSLSYIQELQKEDPRIKIINNQKNMGTLYSRSIGVLSAKGKYIFPLDNGDMFLDYDVFDTISEVAEKDNYDIVEFKAINVGGLFDLPNQRLLNIMFSGHPLNLVLTQPDLGYFPMQPKNETGQFSIVDNYIWNKCIKTEIYQKGLNLFGEERYKRHMTYHEDLIIVILLFNVADTYKFIGKYGVLNVPNSGSGMKGQTTMNLYEMYLIDCMIDFSKDIKENKKIIVQYMITLLGRDMLEQTLKEGDNKKLFDSMLERIANCKYISEEDKNEISNRAVKFK